MTLSGVGAHGGLLLCSQDQRGQYPPLVGVSKVGTGSMGTGAGRSHTAPIQERRSGLNSWGVCLHLLLVVGLEEGQCAGLQLGSTHSTADGLPSD